MLDGMDEHVIELLDGNILQILQRDDVAINGSIVLKS